MALSKINSDGLAPSNTLVTPVVSGLMNLQGGQIKFPAAQNASSDANTLDDYEEGTWACNINGSSGTGVNITGNYTKIGRVVHCLIDFYNQNINSTVGHLRITLPFTVSGSAQGVVSISSTNFDFAMIEPATNNTIAYLYRDGGGGADFSVLTKADWSNPSGASIRGQFSYLV